MSKKSKAEESNVAFLILQGLVTIARNGGNTTEQSKWLVAEIEAALNAERESCALLCDDMAGPGTPGDHNRCAYSCARQIRERKTK